MNYDVIATNPFERNLKRLAKRHKSIKNDIFSFIESLAENPRQGTPLGKNCYKIRIAITSKGKGKSGGARIITFVRISKKNVYLLDIYDKSEKEFISDKDLKMLLNLLD